MDGSVRDFQRHTGQFTPGKNFPATGGFGPALVTSDEIGDVMALPIATRVNGEVLQEASLSDLIFTIPRVIAYVSTFTPLAPGDVIATGTPGGVGERREPPVFLKDGDIVEVDVGRAGTLRNVVMAER
jgi:2-keto-4-pentenoate hydratase/2-oxohepta-3-ene-1,7-dioic acid hydratase in catechol pathway